jgi:hypothetical protein
MKQRKNKKLCDYCGKRLDDRYNTATLCVSRLQVHLKCNEEIWRTKRNTIRARWFRLRNTILAKITDLQFTKENKRRRKMNRNKIIGGKKSARDCQYVQVNIAITNLKNKLKYIVMENAEHLFNAYFEDFEKELRQNEKN